MSSAPIILATTNIQLCTTAPSALASRLEKHKEKINSIWEQALQASGNTLFNGPLFAVSDLNKSNGTTTIQLAQIEYKHFIAQKNGLPLSITPLGVSGVLIASYNGQRCALVARRAANVTQYPGALELVPSGSVDQTAINLDGEIEPQRSLLVELEEEVCIPTNAITDTQLIAVIHDTTCDVIDVCYSLTTSLTPKEILTAVKGAKEYNSPQFIPLHELLKTLTSLSSDEVVPTSIALARLISQTAA